MIRHLTEKSNVANLLTNTVISVGDILVVSPNWWLYSNPRLPVPKEEEITPDNGWKIYIKGYTDTEPIISLTDAKIKAARLVK